jgi:putative oxidoreductase
MRIDIGLFIMRLGFTGLLVWFHGWGRLVRAFNYTVHGTPWTFVDLVAGMGFPLAGVFAVCSALSESIGALLVALGLFSRTAAAIVAINFAVATFSEAAKGDPFELPAMYLVAAIGLILTGPGRISFDTGGRSDRGRRFRRG